MKHAIKNALVKALQSPEVEKIILNLFNRALTRKMEMVDAKTKPGADPVVKQMRVNVLDVITKYLPELEGRTQGLAADLGKSTAGTAMTNKRIEAMAGILLDIEPAVKTAAYLFKRLEDCGYLRDLTSRGQPIQIEDQTAPEKVLNQR